MGLLIEIEYSVKYFVYFSTKACDSVAFKSTHLIEIAVDNIWNIVLYFPL